MIWELYAEYFLSGQRINEPVFVPGEVYFLLFAVPLSITSVQSVIERNTQLEVTSEHYQGAQILLKLYPIIIELERLRDVAVISRMKESEWVTETYNKTRANLLKLLNEFIDEEVFNGSQLFKLNVVKLQRSVEHLLISTGSEADMEHTIFEHLAWQKVN